MAEYEEDAPGPIIGGARRKPRGMWRTRFSTSSDEDATTLPIDQASDRRRGRRVVSISRTSTSQTTVEEDDGQGDYEDADYIDQDVLQSYYAMEQQDQEEDEGSLLGSLDQGAIRSRSPSPQHPLGMRPGDENILEMARGLLPADLSPIPLHAPAPEYVLPGSVNTFGVVEGAYEQEDPFGVAGMVRRPGAVSAPGPAAVVRESLSRLKQKIEDLTKMRVEARSLPVGEGSPGGEGAPGGEVAPGGKADALLQQIQREAEAKYQEQQKQFLKEERIRRCKRRILRKTLRQAIRRAMEKHAKVHPPGAGRKAGIPVREDELMEFSPTAVERDVQDFGADAADLQPIGDNLMGFSPSPKRAKEVPPVGLFLDQPRLVAVRKRLDFSDMEDVSPEKQDFWWKSPEVQVFRRRMTPPVEPPTPPEMDLMTGVQQLPARRSPRRVPGLRIQELETREDDVWTHSVTLPGVATPLVEPEAEDVDVYESPDLVEMSQRLESIRQITSEMPPEEPDIEALGLPASEYVMRERKKRLEKKILSEYRKIQEATGEPIQEDQVVQAVSPVLQDMIRETRGRVGALEIEAREERIRERRRKIIQKARDYAARRAMERHNRRRQREKRRQQKAEGSFLSVDDAGQLRAPSPEPLMLLSPDIHVREYQPQDFGLQAAQGDMLQFSPDPEQERLKEERARIRQEKRERRRERRERRLREEEERRRLEFSPPRPQTPEIRLVAELPPTVQLVAELPPDVPVVGGRVSPQVQLVAELPPQVQLVAEVPPGDAGEILQALSPPKATRGPPKRLLEARKARKAAAEQAAEGEGPPAPAPKAPVKKLRKKPVAAPPPPPLDEPEMTEEELMAMFKPKKTAFNTAVSPPAEQPMQAVTSPVRASPVRASPVRASPVRASPVRASPVRASPPKEQPPVPPAKAAAKGAPRRVLGRKKKQPVAAPPPPPPVDEPEMTEEELMALFKPKTTAFKGLSPPDRPMQAVTSPIRRSPIRESPIRRSPIRRSPEPVVGTPQRPRRSSARQLPDLPEGVLIGLSPPAEHVYDLPAEEPELAELLSLESESDVSSLVHEFDPLRGPPAEVVDRNALYNMLSREDVVGTIGPANREWSPPVSRALYDIRGIPVGDWVPPPPPRVPHDIQEQLVEMVEDLAAEQRARRGEPLPGERFSTPRGKTPPLDSSGEFAREPWVYETPPNSPVVDELGRSISGRRLRPYYTPPLMYDYAQPRRPVELLEASPPRLLTPPLAAGGAGAPLVESTSNFSGSSEYLEPGFESDYVQSQLAFGSPQRNPLLRGIVSTQSPLYERAWKKIGGFFK